MARIALIPKWLDDVIKANGGNVNSTLPEIIKSSIVYKSDVINYYTAQIELLKAIFGNNSIDDVHKLKQLYNQLFYDELPDLPEIEIYLKDICDKPVSYERFTGMSDTDASKVALRIEQSICGSVTYIVARALNDGDVLARNEFRPNPKPIMWNLFKSANSVSRMTDDTTDRSHALRAFPVLSQLYVKTLCVAQYK